LSGQRSDHAHVQIRVAGDRVVAARLERAALVVEARPVIRRHRVRDPDNVAVLYNHATASVAARHRVFDVQLVRANATHEEAVTAVIGCCRVRDVRPRVSSATWHSPKYPKAGAAVLRHNAVRDRGFYRPFVQNNAAKEILLEAAAINIDARRPAWKRKDVKAGAVAARHRVGNKQAVVRLVDDAGPGETRNHAPLDVHGRRVGDEDAAIARATACDRQLSKDHGRSRRVNQHPVRRSRRRYRRVDARARDRHRLRDRERAVSG